MPSDLLRELREVRSRLREVDGVLVTPEALEVPRRTRTSPSGLARYRSDEAGRNDAVGYRLSSELR